MKQEQTVRIRVYDASSVRLNLTRRPVGLLKAGPHRCMMLRNQRRSNVLRSRNGPGRWLPRVASCGAAELPFRGNLIPFERFRRKSDISFLLRPFALRTIASFGTLCIVIVYIFILHFLRRTRVSLGGDAREKVRESPRRHARSLVSS